MFDQPSFWLLVIVLLLAGLAVFRKKEIPVPIPVGLTILLMVLIAFSHLVRTVIASEEPVAVATATEADLIRGSESLKVTRHECVSVVCNLSDVYEITACVFTSLGGPGSPLSEIVT